MAIKYTVRIPTVQYGYVEVEADDWAGLVEGAVNVQDGGAGLYGDATDQAVQNLQAAGVVGTNPGLQQGGYTPSAAASAAPAATGRNCTHGARTRREGTSGKGPWVGHFCPLKKGDPNQCSPEFE